MNDKKLIDTHCHLNAEQFMEDVEATIERARNQGLKKMIVVGCDRITIERAIQLADTHEDIYFTAAGHPVDVIDCTEEDKAYLETVWNHPKMVGIGETGLDYYWDKSPKELQKAFFIWHVEQAIARDLPFSVHNRDAHGDVLEILQELYQKHGMLKGVMHSFSGSVEMATEFMKLGLHISISGVVTFKNAKNVKEVVAIVPEDKLLIETDAPYLTPEPNRGRRNEPAYVYYVTTQIAAIKSETYEKVAQYTTKNAEKLFFT